MENNEDEPDDVRNATPVEDAISYGNRDEENKSIKRLKPKSTPTTSLSDPQEHRRKRCNLFRGKLPKVKKPCHTKADIICRDNLSKDEYIEVLSTPKKNRGLSCKSTSIRKPSCKERVSLGQRLEELSKPKTSHVVNLLETWGSRLRPEIIDAVKNSLEKNCPMSPEQMEAYYNEKRAEYCGRVRKVRRKKCPAVKEKKKEICEDGIDPIAVCEEYEMAQRFMRHIISHLKNSQFAPEDRYDLTEVILSQLGSVLDYRPFGDGDRKFQMMFMLANGIACWVHSLNLAVAEKIAKQTAQDAQEDIETEESEDEDVEEERNDVTEPFEEDEDEDEDGQEEQNDVTEPFEEDENEDEDGQETEVKDEVEETVEEDLEDVEEEKEELVEVKSEPMEEENPPVTEDDNLLVEEVEEEVEAVVTDVDVKIEQDEVLEDAEEESVKPGDVTEDDEPPPEVPAMDEEVEDEIEAEDEETVDEEAHEEVDDMENIEDVETEGKESIASIAETPMEPGLAIQGLGEGDLFASEIPFVTFGKIMEMAVKFLDKYEEAETSEVRRRLQNAVLKKLTNLVFAEAPDALDNNMKAVLEVLAENIAVFMEETLPKSQVNDIETMAPEIESTEVRNWGHWLETVMDNATNWGKWIHEKVGEAEEKAGTKVTRGDWQDWTNDLNSDAIRWRMFNLDTKHQMHHADLNLTHKKVVHRYRRGISISATLAPYQEKDETEIKAYDFADEAEISDKKSDPIEFGEVEN